MKKRLLAMILTLCLIIGLLPTAVFAAETTNSADFNTLSPILTSGGDSSYKDRTTAAGWTASNAAVLVGGPSDANPAFTFVGSSKDTKAICLNGKTSGVGTLNSPTLTGGISKLSITYTNAFTETAGVDITITVNGADTSVSYQLDDDSVTKYVPETYVWTLDTAIAGDFTISHMELKEIAE